MSAPIKSNVVESQQTLAELFSNFSKGVQHLLQSKNLSKEDQDSFQKTMVVVDGVAKRYLETGLQTAELEKRLNETSLDHLRYTVGLLVPQKEKDVHLAVEDLSNLRKAAAFLRNNFGNNDSSLALPVQQQRLFRSRPGEYRPTERDKAKFLSNFKKNSQHDIEIDLPKAGYPPHYIRAYKKFIVALVDGDLDTVKKLYSMLNPVSPINLPTAALSGNRQLINYLIGQGEDINAGFLGLGFTALDHATFLDNQSLITFLMDRGARPDKKDGQGALPADYAIALGYQPWELPVSDLKYFNPGTQAIELIPIDVFEKKTNTIFCPRVLAGLDYFEYAMTGGTIPTSPLDAATQQVLESGGDESLILAKVSDQIGFGVFAGKRFHKGDPIVSYGGMLIDLRHPMAPLSTYDLGGKIGFFDFSIEALKFRNLGAMLNHAPKPNAKPVPVNYKGIKYTLIEAAEDIPFGKQICFSYGEDWFNSRFMPPPLDILSGAEAQFPTHLPLPFLKERAAGNACFRKKDYEGAIAHYSTSIALDASQPESFHNRGLAKFKSIDSDTQSAIDDYKQALKLDPSYARAKANFKVALDRLR
ncbi:MAG: hypothetical protein K940chlam7_00901 [Chlamydiae bacterium]|nr:hypothetical protein [Chlamydiota bacterium]